LLNRDFEPGYLILLYILGSERPPGDELPGVAAEEALAERSLPAHQVHDGSRSEALLELLNKLIACRALASSLLEIQRHLIALIFSFFHFHDLVFF
jgi:hypothetical protein